MDGKGCCCRLRLYVKVNECIDDVAGCLSGGFEFDVWDGAVAGERAEFKVQVNQLALKEKVNRELVIFPGTQTLISEQDLLVQTTDTQTQEHNRTYQTFLPASPQYPQFDNKIQFPALAQSFLCR